MRLTSKRTGYIEPDELHLQRAGMKDRVATVRAVRLKDHVNYALLMGPGLFIYSAIVIFPIFFSLYFSLTQWSGFGTPVFVGLGNYREMFSDPVFLFSIRNNTLIILMSIFGQLPIGFCLAYAIFRKMINGAQFFQAMIFLPVVLSAIIVAILWNQIFAPGGVFTSFMRILTQNPAYVVAAFEDRELAIVPILFVMLWMYTGTYVIIFVANMQKVSNDQLEAAQLDGSPEFSIMTKIILPQMSFVLFTTAIFAIAGSLKSFGLIIAMTGGGPAHYTEVMSIYMYRHTFEYYNYGFGNAVSTVMIIMSVVLILGMQLLFTFLGKKYG